LTSNHSINNHSPVPLAQPRHAVQSKKVAGVFLAAALIGYSVVLLLFLYFSDRVVNLRSGLIICASDCTNFDDLSTIIAHGSLFPPFASDWHYGPMFRAFVMYVAGLKIVFRDAWPVFFVLLNGGLAIALIAWIANRGARHGSVNVFFVLAVGLFIVSPGFLMLSKFLLSDFLFAILFAATAILFADGLDDHNFRTIGLAFIFAAIGMFVRPNGIFVLLLMLCFLTTAIVFRSQPTSTRARLLIASGPFAGICAVLIAISLTYYLHSDATFGSRLPASLREFAEVALRHNAVGSDDVSWETRLGANLWTFPWHSYSMNDGSWMGILGSIVERAMVLFQIVLPPYSTMNNIYRVAYYSPLYILFLIFVIQSARSPERRRDRILLSFFAGYVLIFLAISPVEIRYRLPIEFLMIVGSALAGSRIVQAWRARSLPA
jgi:hypothetical protein